ncbi:MAG: hypothetical protein QNK37_28875 [Acidobacteriota bacterium]|nr:hypothetical protein [Acidobacteriota bacterium]
MFLTLFIFICLQKPDDVDPRSLQNPEEIYAAFCDLDRINRKEEDKSEKFKRVQLMSQMAAQMKIKLIELYRAGEFEGHRASFLLREAYFQMAEQLKYLGEYEAAERYDQFAQPLYKDTSIEPNRVMARAIVISLRDPERAIETVADYISQRPFLQRSQARGRYEAILLRFLAKLQIQAGREVEGLRHLETYLEYMVENPALISRTDVAVHQHYNTVRSRYQGALPASRRNEIRQAVESYGGSGNHSPEHDEYLRLQDEQQAIEDREISAKNFKEYCSE